VRQAVPKAFLVLAPGYEPGDDLAREIFIYVRRNVAPYKRIRRLEFSELPKTISGKIRRVQLRAAGSQGGREFREEDFPDR
jgi:acetyl-CoA synthetase